MELFFQTNCLPFGGTLLDIACNVTEYDAAYRYLHHILIWRYMEKFFKESQIEIELDIPRETSIYDVLWAEDSNACEIERINGYILEETLTHCGWSKLLLQFDDLPDGKTNSERIKSIKNRYPSVTRDDIYKILRFWEIVEEAWKLEIGNYFLMLSSPEIGWYRRFSFIHAEWVMTYAADMHQEIKRLIRRMAEPFYQQYSVNSRFIQDEYVIALSQGREVEHFVDNETLNMNWIIASHVLHHLICTVRRKWERKEKREVGHDASGASVIHGVSQKI